MKKKILMMSAAMFASPAIAEDLSVVGSWSSLPLHKQFEAPFWSTILPEASRGEVSVNLTTHDQMNLGVADVYTLLGQGVYDVGMTVADYAVADAPELEGLDVPLLALTAMDEKALVDAAKPIIEDIYNARFNSHVLAIAPYPPQVVFCNHEIASLDDLKDLKVRASGRMTAKFLEALGAEGVNVSFAEVPGALQKGVVDCAVTGAGSGYSAGWWEVSTHLLPLPLGGWDPVVTAVNLDKWNSLSPDLQTLIQAEVTTKLEDPAWADAQGALENDIACLTGNGTCTSGDSRAMTLVSVSDADFAKAREILEMQVLPEWADRAGPEWTARWNETVGKAAGVSISTN